MTPYRSNSNKENCAPISSNCILWQGPDLPCLSLCREDSISDIIYKLADEVCDIKNSFNYTSVDLQCILTVCNVITPEPTKTLNNILNLIITKVCCLSDIVNAINLTPPEEKQVVLTTCLKPYLSPTGVPYTSLPVSEYLYWFALKYCETVVIVDNHEVRITTLENEVDILMNTPPPEIPQVTTDCISGPGVVPGIPTDIDLVVDLLEKEYCQVVAALGPATDIVKTKAAGCAPALWANPTSLADSTRTLPAIYPGWNTTPANLAQALVNLWITVCDLRGAVKLIQDTCCKISCDTLIVDFDVKRVFDSQGNPVLELFFFPKTNMPSTWFDCNQSPVTATTSSPYSFMGNQLSITDEAGHEYIVYIPLRKQDLSEGILNDFAIGGTGYPIPLVASPLDENSAYMITSNICVTDGTTTCVKCINKNVPYTQPKCDYCQVTACGDVTIIYRICNLSPVTTC